jgi:hypothetical protein
LDVTSDGEYVLQGTTEGETGKLFVLNAGADAYDPMSVEEIIDVGNGAGHVFTSDEHMLAIVTNHADPDEHFLAEDMLDVEAELGDSYLIQGDYNWNEPSGPMGGMN